MFRHKDNVQTQRQCSDTKTMFTVQTQRQCSDTKTMFRHRQFSDKDNFQTQRQVQTQRQCSDPKRKKGSERML